MHGENIKLMMKGIFVIYQAYNDTILARNLIINSAKSF